MNAEHVDDLIELYALGALEPEEQATVDAHLERCAQCRARLEDTKHLVTLLAWTPQQYDPPPELRERTLRHVRHLQHHQVRAKLSWWQRLHALLPGSRSVLSGATAALVMLVLLLGARVVQQQQHLGVLQARLADQEQEITRLRVHIAAQQRVVEVLRSPDARLVSLTAQRETQPARAQMLISPNSAAAYLVAEELSPLAENRTYQLWLIADDQPTSVGIFHPNEQGIATVAVQAPRPLDHYQAAAITIEPAGGSRLPTTEPILLSEF